MLCSKALAVVGLYATIASAASCRTQSYRGTVYKKGSASECTALANAVCQAGQSQEKMRYSYDGDNYNEGNGCAIAVGAHRAPNTLDHSDEALGYMLHKVAQPFAVPKNSCLMLHEERDLRN
ncbi:uncharacterized protein CLUP02_01977 [Colletotrichum lupini]|uniref:Ecp2 effector protein domain-containing protein n=1 Tax=Colletotrichum lupini TaxID=145971 RepID=A0A9Q8W972_9PEZI|nr:uncharacterized protein CLUP02_01977 [Colletotrichum lupini]UQC75323.1 hypothetical protein CLUP02_01977 [Colletotrichum lupini]